MQEQEQSQDKPISSWEDLEEAVNRLPSCERRRVRQYIKEYMLAEDKEKAGKILIRRLASYGILVSGDLKRDLIEGNI